MNEISFPNKKYQIIYADPPWEQLNDFKDLLKKEIDSIAKKHNFDDIISIKFTG